MKQCKHQIVITKRAEDYKVSFKGSPGDWECGKTEEEAISKLIISHRVRLSIGITRKDYD